MIDKEALEKFVSSWAAERGYFVTDINVSPANDITVEVDGPEGVSIDECIELNRAIEAEFDRDKEDYSLEVGTPSLTEPFKVRGQYLKHIGDDVEVLYEGKKYRGVLKSAGDESFEIATLQKVKKEGAKRPVEEEVPMTFPYDKIKYTKYILQF